MMDNFIYYLLEKLIFPFVVIVIVLFLFIGVPATIYGLYQDAKKPTFELKKDEWACTSYEKHWVTTYIMVGKVMVPQSHENKTCIQWSAK